MNWTLLLNSLLVSGLATLLSVVFGLAAALWLAGLTPRWRARWLGVSVIALSLPPFLVTNCWLHYLGTSGTWHRWLPLNIYTLPGTVWILALLLWPITMLAVLGSWQRLEAAQLESDMALKGWTLVRGLLLPLARGALTAAAVLTFVLALNNFAVPAILQVKVFPAEVWVSFNTTFNSLAALEMSWPMVVAPLLLLVWFRRREIAWPRVEGPVPPKLFRQQIGAGWFRGCAIVTIVISALAVGLPLLQLGTTQRTWTELPGAVAAGQSAITNSISFATITATLCVIIGLIAWRLPLGVALWVPFFIPGVLMGIGLIAVFNHPWFAAFYQHAGIVIFALGLRYVGFGWSGAARALRMTDRDLTDVARLSGASRWQLLRHVHWPQIKPQLAVAWYVIFLLCLWDVESMVLIVPPGGETLAMRVFNLLHYGHNTQVNSLCFALLALAIAPLVLWMISDFGFRISDWKKGSTAVCLIFCAIFLTSCSVDDSRHKSLDSKIFSRVEIIGTRGVGVGEFNKPRGITFDHDGNVYVVDVTGRVQKFTPDGKFILLWQMPQSMMEGPKALGCDKDGNIVVVEQHFQRLDICSTTGKLLAQWGQKGTNAGQLIQPRAVAVTSNGDFLVPEYTDVDRVQEFSAKDKKYVLGFGHAGTGPGEFNRPEGIDVDSTGRIYVADSCNHRIQIFTPDGKFLRAYGKPGTGVGEMSYPYDVRVDKEGRQYVCEFENSRIQVFDTNGQSIEIIGRPGAAPGEFNDPYSIALDSHGNLYVADEMNHRVQKLIRRTNIAEADSERETCRAQSNVPARRAHSSFWCSDFLGRSVPPHPYPLPWGEGVFSTALVSRTSSLMEQAWLNGSPSPWGEGRGEGDSSERLQKLAPWAIWDAQIAHMPYSRLQSCVARKEASL
ncbi:MAG TPA: 6-bladed beta-propeller [Verrucomicrobiae bacterium]|nr:6-bladed beta-propeller [Verrucomicrobiae bacterium]